MAQKKAAASTVKITIAHLSAPLEVKRCKPGTTVEDFLAKSDINFTSSVNVNGEEVSATYKLKNGDIITLATDVEGGC